MSGPYPARYGPDPENISPVRVRVPLTLLKALEPEICGINAIKVARADHSTAY